MENVLTSQKALTTAGGAALLVDKINQTKAEMGAASLIIPATTSISVTVPFTPAHVVPAVAPMLWSKPGAAYAGQPVTITVFGGFGLQLGNGLDAAKVVGIDVTCASSPGGGTTEVTNLGPGP